jgi:hypothetical protein
MPTTTITTQAILDVLKGIFTEGLTKLNALSGEPVVEPATPPAGTRMRLVDIHRRDAYHVNRAELIGRTFVVGRDLGGVEEGFAAVNAQGDKTKCNSSGDYFFCAARFEPIAATEPAVKSAPLPAVGSRVRVLAVSPESAHYASREELIGKHLIVTKVESSPLGAPWLTLGSTLVDGGNYLYCYAVQVEPVDAPATTPAFPESLAPGTRVKIVKVPDLPEYAGQIATIGKGGVTFSAKGCYAYQDERDVYSGSFIFDSGQRHFYSVSLEVLPAAPAAHPAPKTLATLRARVIDLAADLAKPYDAAGIACLLGVDNVHTVASYLAEACKAGRIKRVRQGWYVGGAK